MATDSKKPYGDVTYADPGYQDDKKKRYPLDSEEHCRAAWSYINMPKNASKYTSEQLARIKSKIKAALKKYGVETSDDNQRSEPALTGPQTYWRSWALDDIEISRSYSDGRTVEAYCAVFESPTYIKDQHGEYEEVISRTAFNRTLSHGFNKVNCFYHHGMTLYGTPSELGSVPLGTPIDVRVDGRGLRTVTRFNKSQLADSVLESIRNGDIKGYSFNGQIYQSNPNRVPRRRAGSQPPRIYRTELGLKEYGPTPTPAYQEAEILAVRSFFSLSPEQQAEIVRQVTHNSTPESSGLGAGDSRESHSRRQRLLRLRAEAHFRGIY